MRNHLLQLNRNVPFKYLIPWIIHYSYGVIYIYIKQTFMESDV